MASQAIVEANNIQAESSVPSASSPGKTAGGHPGYFILGFLILAFFALAVVDRIVVPHLEDTGALDSYRWMDENAKLLSFMSWRNQADDKCAIWRSESMPVSPGKHKSKRILLLGDSYIWGVGYANANTLWFRQLEKELARRGYSDVEVIGAGKIGDSTRRELNRAEKLLPEYAPDAIVFGYVTNDPDERSRKTGRRFLKHLNGEDIAEPLPKPVIRILSGMYPNITGQWLKVLEQKKWSEANGTEAGYAYEDWELKLLSGKNFEQFRQTVQDVAAFRKRTGVPSFFILLPRGYQSDDVSHRLRREPLSEFLKELRTYHRVRIDSVIKVFEENNIPFIDTLDDFIAHALRDPSLAQTTSPFRLGINPGNGQPGAFCSHFYAVTTADALEKMYPSVLGEKSTPQTESDEIVINDWLPQVIFLKQIDPSNWFFQFPEKPEHCLYLPLRDPYIQFNLKNPVKLSRIKLEGPSLVQARAAVSVENPDTGYDDGHFQKLILQRGSSMQWSLNSGNDTSGRVSSIALSARFKNQNRALTLTLMR